MPPRWRTLPDSNNSCPHGEPLGHEGLIEPYGPDVATLAADEGAQDRAPGRRVPLIQLDHGAVQADEGLVLQINNACQVGQVLIIAREEEDDIPRRFQSQLAQQLGPLRTDPFEELHGRRKQFGRRLVLSRRHRPILAKALPWQLATAAGRQPPARRSARSRYVRCGRRPRCISAGESRSGRRARAIDPRS